MKPILSEQIVALIVSKRCQYGILFILAIPTILVTLYRIPTTGLDLDTPINHYVAWLMMQGYRPYADIFDAQFPGVYLVHLLNIVLLGPGDLGLKIFDFIWTAGVLAALFLLLQRISRIAAIVGVVLLGHWYIFSDGTAMTLEREWVGLLPLLVAMNLIAQPTLHRLALRSIAFGLLLGLAFSIRPQFVLFIPAAGLVFMLHQPDQTLRRQMVVLTKGLIFTAVGFIIPIIAIALWLWAIGALASFVEIATQYMPLYNALKPPLISAVEITAAERPIRTLDGLLLLTGLSFFPLAILSIFFWLQQAPLSMRLHPVFILSVYLLLFGMLHFAVMNKFFLYHQLPFLTGAFLLMSLLFALPEWQAGKLLNLSLSMVVLLSVLFSKVNAKAGLEILDLIRGENRYADRTAMVREVTGYLHENLHQGEAIQILDSNSQGGLHTSLKAGARQATKYIYTFQFYYHTYHPFIQFIRRDFLQALAANRPRFIIDYYQNHQFTELYDFINQHYTVAQKSDRYVIYENRGSQ